MMSAAKEKYNRRAQKINSLLCVGLDSDFAKIPSSFRETANPQFEFNKWVIDQTAEFAAAFKLNIAFYEARGGQGMHELKLTVDYLRDKYSDIFTICDAKRADIGNSNNGYVEELFDYMGFDAVTVHPYMGQESLRPFLDRADKVCIVLVRTSNPGAGELQDLEFAPSLPLPLEGEGLRERGKKLWQIVAGKVANEWNKNHNCMMVMGAPYPQELAEARKIAGEMTFLVPGAGAQGAEVEATIKAGLNSNKLGMIINSSRGIIFAQDPKAEAKKLRDEINKYR